MYALDLLSRAIVHTNVANAVLKVFEPLFTAADGWIGVTLIFGAFAFFWFVGIHGPSIVEPAIAAITYANLETNLLIQAGEHADKVITPGTDVRSNYGRNRCNISCSIYVYVVNKIKKK